MIALVTSEILVLTKVGSIAYKCEGKCEGENTIPHIYPHIFNLLSYNMLLCMSEGVRVKIPKKIFFIFYMFSYPQLFQSAIFYVPLHA